MSSIIITLSTIAALDPAYEPLVINFAIEFLLIARAMNGIGRSVSRRT